MFWAHRQNPRESKAEKGEVFQNTSLGSQKYLKGLSDSISTSQRSPLIDAESWFCSLPLKGVWELLPEFLYFSLDEGRYKKSHHSSRKLDALRDTCLHAKSLSCVWQFVTPKETKTSQTLMLDMRMLVILEGWMVAGRSLETSVGGGTSFS